MRFVRNATLFKALFLLLFGFEVISCRRNGEEKIVKSPDRTVHKDTLQEPAPSELKYKIGQTIYAPVYSEIYFMDDKSKILLGATLSIHNVDPDSSIVLTKVDYFNSKGKLLTHHLKGPKVLRPLQTKEYVVELSEREGGTGANFLVEWRAAHRVTEPLVETIMLSASSSRGVSFVSRGKVVRQWPETHSQHN